MPGWAPCVNTAAPRGSRFHSGRCMYVDAVLSVGRPPSPTVSRSPFTASASPRLPCRSAPQYHFTRFPIYALICDICFPRSDSLHCAASPRFGGAGGSGGDRCIIMADSQCCVTEANSVKILKIKKKTGREEEPSNILAKKLLSPSGFSGAEFCPELNSFLEHLLPSTPL